MTLPEPTLRRLAFVRYLHGVAVEQSRQREPRSFPALLTLQDATELYLHLAAQHLNAKVGAKGETKFHEYLDLIDAQLTARGAPALQHRTAVTQMHQARNAMKHNGVMPSPADLERFRVHATSFFEDNTPALFGIGWADASPIVLVSSTAARTRLEGAERLRTEGKFQPAMIEVAIAFRMIRDELDDLLVGRPSGLTRDLSFQLDSVAREVSYKDRDLSRALERFARAVVDAFDSVDDALLTAELGLGHRRSERLRRLLPAVHHFADGRWEPAWAADGMRPPADDASVAFCIEYVIEAAIRMGGLRDELAAMPDPERPPAALKGVPAGP